LGALPVHETHGNSCQRSSNRRKKLPSMEDSGAFHHQSPLSTSRVPLMANKTSGDCRNNALSPLLRKTLGVNPGSARGSLLEVSLLRTRRVLLRRRTPRGPSVRTSRSPRGYLGELGKLRGCRGLSRFSDRTWRGPRICELRVLWESLCGILTQSPTQRLVSTKRPIMGLP